MILVVLDRRKVSLYCNLYKLLYLYFFFFLILILGKVEKKYTLRYKNAIPEGLKPGEPLPDLRGLNCTNSTISWAIAPNQDESCSKSWLDSSVKDDSTVSTPNKSLLLKSKIPSDLESNSKIISPARDDFHKNFTKMNINGLPDFNIKGMEKIETNENHDSLLSPTNDEIKRSFNKSRCSDDTYQSYSLNSCQTSVSNETLVKNTNQLKIDSLCSTTTSGK